MDYNFEFDAVLDLASQIEAIPTFYGYTPPVVVTGIATSVAIASADLHGAISTIGEALSFFIGMEYGTDETYGNSTSFLFYKVSDVSFPFDWDGWAEGLLPNTEYHYRIVVDTYADEEGDWFIGTVHGADQTFTTDSYTPPVYSVLDTTNILGNGATLNVDVSNFGNAFKIHINWLIYTIDHSFEEQHGINTYTAGEYSFTISDEWWFYLMQPNTTYFFVVSLYPADSNDNEIEEIFNDELSFVTNSKPAFPQTIDLQVDMLAEKHIKRVLKTSIGFNIHFIANGHSFYILILKAGMGLQGIIKRAMFVKRKLVARLRIG